MLDTLVADNEDLSLAELAGNDGDSDGDDKVTFNSSI